MKRSFKYRFEQSENKGLVSAAQNDIALRANDMMLRINDIDLTVKRYCDFVANDITDLK